MNGHLKIVKLLAENGANLDEKTNDGDTLLIKAIEKGNTEIVDLLIKKGANVELANEKDGWTPLVHAIVRANFKIVKLLVDNGANINVSCSYEGNALTPLMFASMKIRPTLIDSKLSNISIKNFTTRWQPLQSQLNLCLIYLKWHSHNVQ